MSIENLTTNASPLQHCGGGGECPRLLGELRVSEAELNAPSESWDFLGHTRSTFLSTRVNVHFCYLLAKDFFGSVWTESGLFAGWGWNRGGRVFGQRGSARRAFSIGRSGRSAMGIVIFRGEVIAGPPTSALARSAKAMNQSFISII